VSEPLLALALPRDEPGQVAAADACAIAIRKVIAQELATQLSADQVREIHGALARVVAEAEGIADRLRVMVSGCAAPGSIAGKLGAITQMGTGYLRTARDIIEAAARL
jgi:hypothetical protein